MKFISAFVIAVVALASSATAYAQPEKGPGEDWKKKMMSEKVAFFTVELDLTPEEAQKFWPVYNQIEDGKKDLQKAVRDSYKALTKALEEGTASDKEIDSLLDTYLAAKQKQKESGKGDVQKFRKVLPSKKVAKLYIAEENFRRHHIRNMKAPQGHGHKDGNGRPGPRR